MEQTNLVVTPDGKTWDQLRDTSYIGKTVVSIGATGGDQTSGTVISMDEIRGVQNLQNHGLKDSWVIAYDRVICLKDGEYKVEIPILSAAGNYTFLKLNGTVISQSNSGGTGNREVSTYLLSHQFKRGDYLQVFGGYWQNSLYSQFRIHKL